MPGSRDLQSGPVNFVKRTSINTDKGARFSTKVGLAGPFFGGISMFSSIALRFAYKVPKYEV